MHRAIDFAICMRHFDSLGAGVWPTLTEPLGARPPLDLRGLMVLARLRLTHPNTRECVPYAP